MFHSNETSSCSANQPSKMQGIYIIIIIIIIIIITSSWITAELNCVVIMMRVRAVNETILIITTNIPGEIQTLRLKNLRTVTEQHSKHPEQLLHEYSYTPLVPYYCHPTS
jgi:hypothetical protein